MAAFTVGIQVSSVIGYIVILFVASAIWRKWPDMRGLIIFPALWSFYGVVYYGLLLAGRLAPDAVFLWGAIHRFLAMLMILGGVVTLWLVMAAPPVPDNDELSDGSV